MRQITLFLLMIFAALSAQAGNERIVSLAPHLTEWVYSLEQEHALLAVSAYSNYPAAAKKLPRVADYQGADLSAIATLDPTLILAWEGGNRPQDIARLQSLGYDVFVSRIDQPVDIASEIERLAMRLGVKNQAIPLTQHFRQALIGLRNRYQTASPMAAFYYSWTAPLMSIGSSAWPNKLLNICGATTIFADSPADYPQVSLQQVIQRQPDVLIAASNKDQAEHQTFWAPHRKVLTAPLITVNPDITSRFTLRLPAELSKLCASLAPYRNKRDRHD
ncbi:helical backbone metal receptor [Alteromonas halophila]|uniref:Vitamin B12-binding protein n=1 Tax=Alteromonas halophila TaxID=516698 RepID=A0A918N0F9_9ALTE|nr:helical backbone metal receptor [Alteromonas halophila]GGW97809.1 vitamin B12-binding protein [Alteromonas halophila]